MLSNTGQFLSSPPAMYLKATQPSSMCVRTKVRTLTAQHGTNARHNSGFENRTRKQNSVWTNIPPKKQSKKAHRGGGLWVPAPQRNATRATIVRLCPQQKSCPFLLIYYFFPVTFVAFKQTAEVECNQFAYVFKFLVWPFTVLVEQKKKTDGHLVRH